MFISAPGTLTTFIPSQQRFGPEGPSSGTHYRKALSETGNIATVSTKLNSQLIKETKMRDKL